MGIPHKLVLWVLTALLLGLSGGVPGPVWAGAPTLSASNGKGTAVLVARKAKKSKRPSSRNLPVIVQDLRYKAYPDFTRLVLDLQQSVTFTQSRQQGPNRVIIELQNSRLSYAAKRRLTDQAFPEAIAVSQPHPNSVTLEVNLEAVTDYKLLPLSRPERLVLDVFTTEGGPASSEEEEAELAPAQPVMTLADRPPQEIKTIVIDPGHGGKDPGALGRNKTTEKDVTLQVGLILRDMITQRLGKKVLMTRSRDVFVELEDRAKFANKHEADLFVSIHVNSHPRRSVRGLEVYHFGEASDRRALEVAARENGTPIGETSGINIILADLLTSKKIEDSLELAWTTKQAMVTHLGSRYDVEDHGVKTAPFYVLRFTAMPSILAEIAFISNPTEERQMRSKAYLTRMAESIYEGIKAYLSPLQTAAN